MMSLSRLRCPVWNSLCSYCGRFTVAVQREPEAQARGQEPRLEVPELAAPGAIVCWKGLNNYQ